MPEGHYDYHAPRGAFSLAAATGKCLSIAGMARLVEVSKRGRSSIRGRGGGSGGVGGTPGRR
jgi:hypothetical protein